MAHLKSNNLDIYNLGVEMIYRGIRPWEHPSFGGVNPRYHIKGSKHLDGRAVDLNVWNAANAVEDKMFDNLNLELIGRLFGTIWNRQRTPGDHERHLHAETLTEDEFRNPSKYFYLPRYHTKDKRHLYRYNLVVDGTWGRKTTLVLQRWLFVSETGTFDKPTIKALQAFLNTENRGNLVIDGIYGSKSIRATQSYLGTQITGAYSSRNSQMVAKMQSRLNRYSRL